MARVEKTKEKLKSVKPPSGPSSYSVRLRKGKLRNMGRPLTASAPAIDQCRGIFGGSGLEHGILSLACNAKNWSTGISDTRNTNWKTKTN